MLHAPPVSLLPWCPCRAFFAARLPLSQAAGTTLASAASPPCLTLVLSCVFAYHHFRRRSLFRRLFHPPTVRGNRRRLLLQLQRRPPVFNGPDCALAALGYQRPPLRASSMPFFIFTSRPPSPSRDRGSPPCVSRRPRRLALRPCAAILISSRLSFLLFPEGAGERFCVSSGRDPM